jgi:hypothetical protein
MKTRGLAVHVALLALAGGSAVWAWTRDKKPALAATTVTVWNARPADVDRVAFEAKSPGGEASRGKTVALESKKDGQGRYFVGSVEGGPKPAAFVSVAAGEKVAEAFAPLRAIREIGRVEGDHAADFGLNEPDGKLRVRVAGADHELTVGARTPGGGDRYVRDDASGIVYVLKGEATRDLEAGEGSLAEHDLHAFKDGDLDSVRISARGKAREVLRRGPESKRIWADPADPERADETVSNWLAKIDRLRPTEYPVPQPASPEIVVRLEYKARGAQGAFFELAKVAGEPKPDYLVRTERTRQWAKAFTPVGEQVEQDLASVLR